MSLRLHVLPEAELDLRRQSDYFKRSSIEVALRFLDCARQTMQQLIAAPEMGGRCTMLRRRLRDIRVLPIADFPNLLVFYRYDGSNLEVIRVIHGARNWATLLRYVR